MKRVYTQAVKALQEAVEVIKSKSRSEFDSGPKYTGDGAEWLKKWGFE